jgi:predicted nuclease of predicted toxin-antitoxin system
MKILLDECLPRRLKDRFSGHDCHTVPRHCLAAKRTANSSQLQSVRGLIFLTMDKGLQYEQNLAGRQIAVIILRAKSNRLADLVPLVEACLTQMRSIKPGHVARVGE